MGKDWVDFRQVKQAVSMQMIVDRYGIELKRRGNELRGRCPIHKGDGDRVFHVNTSKNVFNCFSCKARGNVLDLVAALEQCSVRDAALLLKDWFAVPDTEDSQAAGPERPKKQDEAPLDDCMERGKIVGEKVGGANQKPVLVNPALPFRLMVNSEHEYGLSRGLSKDTLEFFGAGFCRSKGKFAGRFVIPLHNETGDLVGYAGRAVDDSLEPKYLFPSNEKGFYKSHLLYNLNRVRQCLAPTEGCESSIPTDEPVVVVEGLFSAMTLWQQGLRLIVSLLGTSLSDQQEDLLFRHFKRIVLLFDGDSAGRSATTECLSRLGRGCWVRAISLDDDVQPDHLTPDELSRLLGS